MTAARATADVSNERIELLVLTVGGHRCAFELGRVKQVVDYPRVTRVPGTPDAVDGVASVGGEVAAVLDARRLFGLSGSDEPSFTVLDRKADAQAVGVVTCHVDTVEVYPLAAIQPTSEYETDDGLPFVFDDRYVRAVLTANEPIPVMDADALVMAVASDLDEPAADEPAENERQADDAPNADATDNDADADAIDADAIDANAIDANVDDADADGTDAVDADAVDADADGADPDGADAVDADADGADPDDADADEVDVGDDESAVGDDEVDEAATDREADTADDTERQ